MADFIQLSVVLIALGIVAHSLRVGWRELGELEKLLRSSGNPR